VESIIFFTTIYAKNRNYLLVLDSTLHVKDVLFKDSLCRMSLKPNANSNVVWCRLERKNGSDWLFTSMDVSFPHMKRWMHLLPHIRNQFVSKRKENILQLKEDESIELKNLNLNISIKGDEYHELCLVYFDELGKKIYTHSEVRTHD
jgi:hypothetical protein